VNKVTAVPEGPDAAVTIRRPAKWALHRVERSGWFTTRVTWDLPDGRSARLGSRAARKRGRVEPNGNTTGVVNAEPVTARRLWRINLVAAISFTIGGSLFALGAAFAQLGATGIDTIDITYLVGGVFFSLGGYASVLQAINTPTDIDERGALSSKRWSWWKSDASSLGWLSALVLFVGTLFFGVSLIMAFAENLTVRQSNGLIWIPDILGCVCFLGSGHLALVEVCHGRIGFRFGDLGWGIVAINQLGSVLFFLAGVAAYTRPATSAAVNADIANWGTFLGAACFAIGGVMQVFEKPT
jgi:hypothetical protein